MGKETVISLLTLTLTFHGMSKVIFAFFSHVFLSRMPCCLVSIELEDMAKNVQHHIESRITKTRLDLHGQPMAEAEEHAIGGSLKNESHLEEKPQKDANCGSCYGAGEENECCNTCEQVRKAYEKKQWSMPSLHTIEQCSRDDFENVVKGNIREGCNVRGSVNVTKVAGKLYFAPGQIFQQGYLHAADILDFTFKNFDNSHRINHLVFGELYPDMKNPLNGMSKELKDYGSYQYYTKVVSTEFQYLNGKTIDTNQFSVTEHFKTISPGSGRGLPDLTFVYEFDPIMFRIEQQRKGFLQFLTSVCAIVGGVFTVMGLIDAIVFSLQNKRTTTTPLSK